MIGKEPLRIGILGAGGRIGRLLPPLVAADPELHLSAAIVSARSQLHDTPVVGSALKYTNDLAAAISVVDLWIDFSTPAAALELAKLCAENRTPLLVASTGFSHAQVTELRALSARTAILFASNTSLGILALRRASRAAQEVLGGNFDIAITEAHHRKKKDAPSGTARTIAEDLQSKACSAIEISSIRAGDIVGEHTVFFAGAAERIEITHRASDPTLFARGALVLAKALANRAPGYLTPEMLL